MRTTLLILVLVALSQASCGDLVDLDSWPSNRTFTEGGGGMVQLDRLTLTIGRDGVPSGTHVRIVQADDSKVPVGALAESYEILLEGAPRFADAYVAFAFDLEELPEGVYYVHLVLAKAEGGTWVPLSSLQDPISGLVKAPVSEPGVYGLIQKDQE